MGLLFYLILRLTFWAFLVLGALTVFFVVLFAWAMLWLLGFVLAAIYVGFGDTARARKMVKRSPPRVVSQAKWSNRR